ncbi:MAG: Holliday junction resolvase RuvX [Candidatus Paceibacteria bacterium]
MRIMGIDYGSKKVGIALTDPSGRMAFPHCVIPNTPKLFSEITDIIKNYKVEEVVIGQSIDKNGAPNAIQAKAESLMIDLTLASGLPVHFEPEQFTTKQAERLQGKHKMIDASAAALIVESYLMKQK